VSGGAARGGGDSAGKAAGASSGRKAGVGCRVWPDRVGGWVGGCGGGGSWRTRPQWAFGEAGITAPAGNQAQSGGLVSEAEGLRSKGAEGRAGGKGVPGNVWGGMRRD